MMFEVAFAAVWLAIPILFVGVGNTTRSRGWMAVRVLAAWVASWMWLAWSSVAITTLDITYAKSASEITASTNGDGARHVFALLLGWLPSAVLVAIAWAGLRVFRRSLAGAWSPGQLRAGWRRAGTRRAPPPLAGEVRP